MKVRILLDEEYPKVPVSEIEKAVLDSGLELVTGGGDIGVVVGGDGLFGRVGRTEEIPLLFVGIRPKTPTDTKAFMAAAYFDSLPEVLRSISYGRFGVIEHGRLEILKNSLTLGDVFTDVYLQRGAEPASLRYSFRVEFGGGGFDEYGIGDGVIFCTRAGSSGYYSYVEKVKMGDWLDSSRYVLIREDEIGVCHIVPNFTQRIGMSEQPLRYTVPWESVITLRLDRQADARLYGLGKAGLSITTADEVVVRRSPRTTKLVKV